MRSHYAEFSAPPALRDRIMCLWTQHIDHNGGSHPHPVLPDGCVDIVWIGEAPPLVAGPATRRVIVDLPAGVKLTGIRFRPGWAAACLGVPAHELRDRDVPLGDIWRRTRGSVLKRLLDVPPSDAAVRTAVEWLAQHPAGRIGELARVTGMGERQLHRRFREAVGYAPKTFQRILRFQRFLMTVAAREDLAAAATDAGYADQAHMCREVRELAAVTLSDLFNTGEPLAGYPKPSMIEWLRRSRESTHYRDHPGRRQPAARAELLSRRAGAG